MDPVYAVTKCLAAGATLGQLGSGADREGSLCPLDGYRRFTTTGIGNLEYNLLEGKFVLDESVSLCGRAIGEKLALKVQRLFHIVFYVILSCKGCFSESGNGKWEDIERLRVGTD